jgi:DNA repair exonuclease SbcCD nuclease subunit
VIPSSSVNGRAVGRGSEIVVVHSSDIHVDDGYTARLYGGDGTAGLRSVLATARGVAADVVLLAGDVFEHNRLPPDIVAQTADLLASAGMPVVMLPGNHDPAIDGSVYRRGICGVPNVCVLGITHSAAVLFPDFDLEVWGNAHLDYGNEPPLRSVRPRSTRWQIAMAHGHYDGSLDVGATHRPSWLISDADIAATGADYVALGHWNRAVRVGTGAVKAYYSGSPELAGTVNVVRLAADGAVEVGREPIRWDRPPPAGAGG